MLHTTNRLATLFALSLSLTPALIFGQASFEAQVRGAVRDASGSVIIGARVTITDVSTNISNSTATDDRGFYIFNGLHPATYIVKAEAAGFRAEETKNVVLGVSQHTNVDFALQVAGLETSMTIVEAAPTLETGDAAIGTTITGQYTRDMPLYGRSYFGLVFLSGGVTEAAGGGISDNYPTGTNFISNGQRNSSAEIRFDGAPLTAPEQGEGGNTNVYYTPSVEVIQEFKVQNNSFSAEYGNNGGTVINITMRQGGNQFHGSGWYFAQRDVFNANDFFSNAAGLPIPPFAHDQEGGMISGPIKRNKAFFLFDYERFRDVGARQSSGTFPTDLQRQGNFSQTMTFDNNGNLAPVVIYNPFSIDANGVRLPFANNIIPPNMLDPVAKNLLAYFPEPTLPGDAGTNYNNFRRNTQARNDQYQLDGRVDFQINDNNRLGARYSRLESNSPGRITYVADRSTSFQDTDNAVVDYNWTISPKLLYTGRIGVDFVNSPVKTHYPDLTSVGFPSYLENGGLKRMPGIAFGNAYTGIFGACCNDTNFTHTLITYSSALSWVKGAHSFKFGGEQRQFFNNFWQPSFPTGQFTFDQNATNQTPNNGDPTQGDSFASFLLGYGSSGNLQEIGAVADKSKETGFYVQDDWKVNSKLTVNLGLRYEWSTPYSERYNRSTFADFRDSSGITVPGLGTLKGITLFPTSGRRNIPVDRNNFAPRVGFAYSWDSKTVIRGGAGIYYGGNIATNYQYPGPAFSSTVNAYFYKNNYQTQFGTLDNPFPTGIAAPQGNKYGKLAQWGLDNSGDLDYETDNNADIYQWSVGIQRLLPSDIVIGVDYSASRSTHLPWGGFRNLNFIPTSVEQHYTSDQLGANVANPFQSLFAGPNAIFNEPTSRYNQSQIPLSNLLSAYPQFDGGFQGLPILVAMSRYDSMQLRFEKRSGKYFTIQGSYTLSRNTDDSSAGANAWNGYINTSGVQDPNNLSREYGLSANNATHRLAAAFTGNIPIGRGLLLGSNMNRVVDAVIGGWSASTNMTLQSGQPVTIQMALARLANGQQRPNVTCSNPNTGLNYHDAAAALLNGNSSGLQVFNPSCFADPGDQQLGNAPRYFTNLNSPGIEVVDIGLRKEFHIRETMKFQIRMEAFNAFNRTRFDRAHYSFGSGSFGQVDGLGPGYNPRQLQIVARFEF
jgi:hypothetical protein